MVVRCVNTRMECPALIHIFFTACLLYGSADTHSLRYLYTAVTPGISFPEFTAVGLLDGEQFMSYSSSNQTLILKDSIKKFKDQIYWQSENQDMQNRENDFTEMFKRVKKKFNHSKGLHTLQRMYGCELDDDGTTRGYDQYAYDGDDFIRLNLTAGTWTADNVELKWQPDRVYTNYWKNYVENTCTDDLKKYGKEVLIRKVGLEVSVFQKHSSPSAEIVCHATGFFPKPLNITWQKDGEDVHEDVEIRETLPNQNGSFQKRIILKVPAEELQKHKYTCVVQHSSLEKELVLSVIKCRILKGGALIAVIVAVVAALVALVAVVAGIVVWKKKNSGFKPVPPTGSSEGDSSNNDFQTVTVCLPAGLRRSDGSLAVSWCQTGDRPEVLMESHPEGAGL